jgi:GntR family transcriptional regulator
MQLASLFRRFIVAGQWRVGERIPTHDDLAAQFEVNPATIRKAIELLTDEGLVAPYRRHGTFVTSKPMAGAWMSVPTTWQDSLAAFDGLTCRWIDIQDAMKLPRPPDSGTPANAYSRIRRAYYRDELAVCFEEAYLDATLKSELGVRKLKQKPTLQLIFDSRKPGSLRAEEIVEFGVAGSDAAGILDISLNAPLAIARHWLTDENAKVLYWVTSYYRGELVRISEEISVPNPTRS